MGSPCPINEKLKKPQVNCEVGTKSRRLKVEASRNAGETLRSGETGPNDREEGLLLGNFAYIEVLLGYNKRGEQT